MHDDLPTAPDSSGAPAGAAHAPAPLSIGPRICPTPPVQQPSPGEQ